MSTLGFDKAKTRDSLEGISLFDIFKEGISDDDRKALPPRPRRLRTHRHRPIDLCIPGDRRCAMRCNGLQVFLDLSYYRHYAQGI
jgi:hypothetical protein